MDWSLLMDAFLIAAPTTAYVGGYFKVLPAMVKARHRANRKRYSKKIADSHSGIEGAFVSIAWPITYPVTVLSRKAIAELEAPDREAKAAELARKQAIEDAVETERQLSEFRDSERQRKRADFREELTLIDQAIEGADWKGKITSLQMQLADTEHRLEVERKTAENFRALAGRLSADKQQLEAVVNKAVEYEMPERQHSYAVLAPRIQEAAKQSHDELVRRTKTGRSYSGRYLDTGEVEAAEIVLATRANESRNSEVEVTVHEDEDDSHIVAEHLLSEVVLTEQTGFGWRRPDGRQRDEIATLFHESVNPCFSPSYVIALEVARHFEIHRNGYLFFRYMQNDVGPTLTTRQRRFAKTVLNFIEKGCNYPTAYGHAEVFFHGMHPLNSGACADDEGWMPVNLQRIDASHIYF